MSSEFFDSVNQTYDAIYEVRDHLDYLRDNLETLMDAGMSYNYDELLKTNPIFKDFKEKLEQAKEQALTLKSSFAYGNDIVLTNIDKDEVKQLVEIIENTNEKMLEAEQQKEQSQKKGRGR